MKKLVLLLTMLSLFMFLISCEKQDIIDYDENIKFQVDLSDVDRPGTKNDKSGVLSEVQRPYTRKEKQDIEYRISILSH